MSDFSFTSIEHWLGMDKSMNSNTKLTCAIAAILSGSVTGIGWAAAGADPADSESIQEITVTAQRRTENVQDVPIQIQALTAQTLTQLNVSTFDDIVKYLPNVTIATTGPGQGNIYMRGLSVGAVKTQGSGGGGSFPNVAVYLDDQAGQLPGRNLDVYAADLERIEVLEGPQGTLFGAGAQAGVLRYITNKPKIDVTEGIVNASYGFTSHGDHNSQVNAAINLPVIAETLAVRAVIFSDTQGGYIKNVPGTFAREDGDLGIFFAGYPAANCGTPGAPACAVPPGSPTVNNDALTGNAINPVTYQGIRVSGLWKVNDDWDVLLTQSYQDMNAQGVFYETPLTSGTAPQALPDLSVQLYNPSYDKDKFENTALTVTGQLYNLKLVYSGAYLVRNVRQIQDYTNYARGVYADYYQCVPNANPALSQCFTPSATWKDAEKDTHQSHELRLSTPETWRLRAIGGLFWEDSKIHEQADYQYKTAPGFTPVGPPPTATSNNPNVRNDSVAFFDDITRGYTQKAVFASVDVDLVPNKLTATVGTRYYRFDNTQVGSSVSSFGCYMAGPPPCLASASNLNSEGLRSKYSGFKSRANVSWHITDDALVYYTWSQGFRPGGFNRSSTLHLDGAFATPIGFAPDTLTNNEIGWKTEWLDHRVVFNGAAYQEDWKNVQVSFFDPQGGLGNLVFTTNGPAYRVRGVEIQLVARPVHGLTLTGGAAWNSSNQTNSPYLIGTSGQPITSIPNPYGPIDSPLAQSPPFQANLRARYEIDFNDYHPFFQVGGQHQAHSYSATGYVESYDQPSFTTYDASIGVVKDAWTVQFYGQNITDVRAITFINNNQFIVADFIERPRTGGVQFSYKF